MRSCEGCTKCCEGYLPATIKGHSMYPGKPCHFVIVGAGCSIYEDRPERPCKSFECFWKVEEVVPEKFKPSLSNTILTWGNPTGFKELLFISAGGHDEEFVDWFADYVTKNGINATWNKNGQQFFNGSQEYIEKRKEENNKKYEEFNFKDA